MSAQAIRCFAATAAVTVRGFLRDRSFTAALLACAVAPVLGSALASASVGGAGRFAADLGWASAGMLGWLIALAHGSGLTDGGGVLRPFALSRPVSPPLLLAGRFAGLALGLLLYASVATALLTGWLASLYGAPPAPLAGAGWLLFLRLVVVAALATAFLAILRPAAAAVLATTVAAAGWFVPSAPAAGLPPALCPLAALGRFLVPDLSALDAPNGGLSPGFGETLAALGRPTLYAALYAGGAITIALLVFPSLARRAGRAS